MKNTEYDYDVSTSILHQRYIRCLRNKPKIMLCIRMLINIGLYNNYITSLFSFFDY